MPKFVAQSLARSRTSEDRRRVELTFVDATGAKQACRSASPPIWCPS
jgi:hypothetical protein